MRAGAWERQRGALGRLHLALLDLEWYLEARVARAWFNALLVPS